jgi:hypothetical protein
MKHLTLALTLLATPTFAQDNAILVHMTRDLDKPEKALRAAYAACIAGNGQVEATARPFTENGWTRSDDTEMGLITLTPAEGDLYVTLAADGSFCDVASESQGTDAALSSIQILSGAAGLPVEMLETGGECLAASIGMGMVEIMSSGNDPVCLSETTSAARFFFTPGQ